jgi:hypothetical protein
MRAVTVAYREIDGDEYHVLWPKNSSVPFSVASSAADLTNRWPALCFRMSIFLARQKIHRTKSPTAFVANGNP